MADDTQASAWPQRFRETLEEAVEESRRLQHAYVGVEHLFNAMARQRGSWTEQLLLASGVDPAAVRDAIRWESGAGAAASGEPQPTPRLLDVLSRASRRPSAAPGPASERELLEAILEEGQSLPVRYLASIGHGAAELLAQLTSLTAGVSAACPSDGAEDYDRTILASGQGHPTRPTAPPSVPSKVPQAPAPGPPITPHEAVPVSLPTPTLDKLGRDLSKLARLGKLADAVGREEELEQIVIVLARTQKSNPLLLGEAGVGKTAIIEGLAWRITQGQVPSVLRGKRVVEIDMGTVTAGTSLRGQFEERVRELLREAADAPEVILFIDEIHTIVGAGKGDGAMDAAQLFKPALARGDIRCIGATTQDEYSRYIRKDPALERRFSPVTIREMAPEATLRVLEKVAPRIIEKQAGRAQSVSIAPEALWAAVSLTDKHVKDRHQPDKAIDALDIACASAVVRGTGQVTAENVARVVSDWTGIPADRLTADRRERFARMEEVLSQRVIGQDAAVATVSRSVRTAMAGLKAPNRPIGVFLFIGASGVGKTKFAKELAAFLFNTPEALIRLDMGEYQEKHAVSNLVGAPAGYVGSEEGGRFTEALRRRPYSVVLLDEIEKAHPDVFDIFLSVFDDGRVTDNHGRVVDCSNAVFILTSNLKVGGLTGFSSPALDLRTEAARFLRPELVNRLTDIVQFAPLGRKELARILDHLVADKSAAFRTEHGITVSLDESAREMVLSSGIDPQMGARPLERAVDRMIVQPLVDALFAGQGPAGELLAVVREGRIVFLPKETT